MAVDKLKSFKLFDRRNESCVRSRGEFVFNTCTSMMSLVGIVLASSKLKDHKHQ